MIVKRFKLYEHKDNDYILDNPNEHLDFIEMLGDALTSEEIVDLLNKLEEENRQLRLELDTHKHPLWSTREAERIVNELKQENEKLKQQRDFYYARLQKIIKIANGDLE